MAVRCCSAAFLILAMAGCASDRAFRPMEDVYDEVHRQGQRDTVAVLRESLRERLVYGASDPYVPLRVPEEIAPIWIPPHVDPRTGRRVDGHWEHTVIRRSEWFTQ